MALIRKGAITNVKELRAATELETVEVVPESGARGSRREVNVNGLLGVPDTSPDACVFTIMSVLPSDQSEQAKK